VDVLFLDTGLHFAETLRVRDLVQRTLPVTVRSIRPRQSVAEQDAQYGPRLYAREPDECCALRKVEPLERGLERYDACAAGLRRGSAPRGVAEPRQHARGELRAQPGQGEGGAAGPMDPGRRRGVHLPL